MEQKIIIVTFYIITSTKNAKKTGRLLIKQENLRNARK